MGIVIGYSGQLRSQEAYETLITQVRSFGAARHWEMTMLDEQECELTYWRPRHPEGDPAFDPEDLIKIEYKGPARGIRCEPHPDCESLTFQFDRDLYFEDFTKTQFAGLKVHMNIVELLRQLEPLFVSLRVEDEAEFWETGDVEVLAANFGASTAAIEKVRAMHAGDSSGGIVSRIKSFLGWKK